MANSTQAAKNNIVCEWLRSLHLGQYAESFLDNGYDDLEICKQVGEPDLDAIGVLNAAHRRRLLHSVRTLREEGAASVYFALEEAAAHAQAAHEPDSDDDEPADQCASDIASSARSSKASSGRSDKEGACGTSSAGAVPGPSAPDDPLSTTPSTLAGKYADEYEEGKAELVKIPRVQLKVLLKDRLQQDGVRLSCQPYSTQVSYMVILGALTRCMKSWSRWIPHNPSEAQKRYCVQ
nr:unnamed protein product [Callosobruchus analis]